MTRPPPMPTLFPYTTLFRSGRHDRQEPAVRGHQGDPSQRCPEHFGLLLGCGQIETTVRSEEHTSELQSRGHLVCRLLLEKKKKRKTIEQSIKHICRRSKCRY